MEKKNKRKHKKLKKLPQICDDVLDYYIKLTDQEINQNNESSKTHIPQFETMSPSEYHEWQMIEVDITKLENFIQQCKLKVPKELIQLFNI